MIYLVRHGETSFNRDGLGLGRADPPLTDLGRRQAAAVALRLAREPVTRVLSSPLARATETARAIAGEHHFALEIRAELTELDAGEADGVPLSELRSRHGNFLDRWMGSTPADVPMPGGESVRDVANRLAGFVEELRQSGEESIAVVSHNFVLKTLVCELLGIDLHRFRGISVDLASVSTIAVTRRGVSIVALNDCCHLYHLNLDPVERSV
jgi:broad specificity phosphatase PhoE